MSSLEDAERRSAIRTAEALQRGEMPHNPELEHILDRASATLAEQQASGRLQPEGQQIARDAQDVVNSLKVALAEKNQDELIQRLHMHTKEATKATANVSEAISSYDRQRGAYVPSAREAANNIMTLVRSIITDSELRTLLWDFALLLQDTMYNLPRQAPMSEHSFEGATNQRTWTPPATTKTFSPSMPAQPLPMGAESPMTSTWTSSSTSHTSGQPEYTSFMSSRDEGIPVITTFVPRNTRSSPEEVLEQSERMFDHMSISSPNTFQPGEVPCTGGDVISDLTKQQVTGGGFSQPTLGEVTSESAGATAVLNPLFLAHAIPPERQALLRNRFVDIMVALHRSPERTAAVRQLASMTYSAGQKMSVIHNDPAVATRREEILHEAQRLLEAFAMNKSLDPLIQGWRSLITQFRSNPETQSYMTRLYNFFVRSLDDRAYVSSESYRNDLTEALRGGRSLLYQYRPVLYSLTRELDDFLQCLRRDDTSRMLAESTQRLSQDIFMRDDLTGRTILRPGVIPELRKLLISLIAGQLTYIAIPCLQGSTDSMDYEVDNVVLRGVDILPDRVHLENTNVVDLQTRVTSSRLTGQLQTDPTTDNVKSSVYLRIEDIRASMHDVQFWYQRKVFPRVTDRGKLDLFITGKGITLDLWLATDMEHLRYTLRPVKCVAHVSKIKVKNMTGEQHRTMYKIFKPVIQSQLRRALANAIEENVNKLVVMLDEQLTNIASQVRTKIPSKLGMGPTSPTSASSYGVPTHVPYTSATYSTGTTARSDLGAEAQRFQRSL